MLGDAEFIGAIGATDADGAIAGAGLADAFGLDSAVGAAEGDATGFADGRVPRIGAMVMPGIGAIVMPGIGAIVGEVGAALAEDRSGPTTLAATTKSDPVRTARKKRSFFVRIYYGM